MLVGAEPSENAIVENSPTTVRLFFSEGVDPEFFALEVYDAHRERIDRGDAHVAPEDSATLQVSLPNLESGTYVVAWRVLSLDSHVVTGAHRFSIGADVVPAQVSLDFPRAGVSFPEELIVRSLTFLSTFVLFGGLVFRVLVASVVTMPTRARSVWLVVAWAALSTLAILTVLTLLIQAASAAGVPLASVLGNPAIARVVNSRFGVIWGARVACIVGMAIVLTQMGRRGSRVQHGPSDGVVLGGGVLLSMSITGHAAAVAERAALAIAADWLHLLAGGVWVGGLVCLAIWLLVGLPDSAEQRRHVLARLVQRFSLVGGISVAVIVVTGLYAALLNVPSWQALFDTAYGAALSGKLLLLLPLLALAGLNLLVLNPRFRRAERLSPSATYDAVGQRVFRGLVFGEIAVASSVLVASAILVGLPPAVSLPLEGKAVDETAQLVQLATRLEVTPNQAGDNRIAVQVTDPDERPIANAQVGLTLTMLEMRMGARELEPRPDGRGRYIATGSYLSMPGRWRADVAVRTPSSADQAASFTFAVGQARGAYRPSLSPGYVVYLAITDPDRRDGSIVVNPRLLAALALLTAAALAVLLARRLPVKGFAQRTLPATAVVLLAAGTALGSVSIAEAYRKSLPNPVVADAPSIERGRVVYQRCVVCHGAAGRGDGPLSRTLQPRPADFRVHMAAGHTDRQLFDWVTRGIDATAMPAFGDQVSEQERWDVINYIRGFAGS
ncbi:MAG: copper resistance protein CopC [Chloroflexi bacterium]|nr:copper resistance protein CopC [Chloroflexota bacterium]